MLLLNTGYLFVTASSFTPVMNFLNAKSNSSIFSLFIVISIVLSTTCIFFVSPLTLCAVTMYSPCSITTSTSIRILSNSGSYPSGAFSSVITYICLPSPVIATLIVSISPCAFVSRLLYVFITSPCSFCSSILKIAPCSFSPSSFSFISFNSYTPSAGGSINSS